MEEGAETKNKFTEKASNSIANFIYSKKDRTLKYLFVLLGIGFILRLIAALNLSVLADDMIEASQSAGIIGAKVLSTTSHPALYFYLTDFTYNLIGYTTLASRLWPLLAGTMTILLAFLITDKLFNNKRIAIFATIFVTFSAFLVRNTFAEMSNIWLFFAFLGIYLGMLYLEKKKPIFIYLSGIAFGLGFLTKYNMPFFVIAFLLFSLSYLKQTNQKIITKKHIKHLIIFGVIIFVFALPPLTFNYLLYKDKGIMDIYFSRVIQTEQTQALYGSLAGQGTSFFQNLLDPVSYSQWLLVYHTDLILFILGLAGFGILLYMKKLIHVAFLSIFLIVPFVLQSAGSYLAKHFVFMPFIFAIPAAYALNEVFKKTNNKKIIYVVMILLITLLIFNLGNAYNTPEYYLDSSPTSQLKSYVHNNVNENDLIIYDPRIYTSRSFFIALPNHLLDLGASVDFFNQHQELPDELKTPTNVYFIECSIDDCGWGTIKNQPEVNSTVEQFFSQFPDESAEITIYGKEYEGNEFTSKKQGPPVYTVHKQTIPLNPQAVAQTDNVNSFYFTPYLYKQTPNYLFDYQIHSLPDRLLNSFSYFVILFSMFLTLISFILVFYLVLKNRA